MRSKPQSRSPLRVLSSFYFLNYGALGAFFPFIPLLFAARGLSPVEISWIMVISPAASLIMPPLWGGVADALRARTALLRLSAFGSAIGALLFLPLQGFWGCLLAMAVLSLFRTPVPSLADAATCAALGDDQTRYGRVRAWGSVGFAFFSLVMGLSRQTTSGSIVLLISASIFFASGLTTLALISPPIHRERGILREVMSVVARPAMLFFVVGGGFYYMAHSIYDAYFSLHLHRQGLSDSYVGGAWALGVMMEVVVMSQGPSILAGRRSASLLCLAACSSVLRWGLTSRCGSSSAFLAVQLLHGLTYGLWYVSLVRQVQASAPERLRTSLQSVALSVVGCGSVVGYLWGGRLFQSSGGSGAFTLAAAAALVALLCYSLTALLEPRPRAVPTSA